MRLNRFYGRRRRFIAVELNVALESPAVLAVNENLQKIILAVGAVLGVLFIYGSVEANGLFSDDTAAWVQAVGSIAAVVGAAWIANHGSREQQRKDKESDLRRERERLDDEAQCRRRAAALVSVVIVELGKIRDQLVEKPDRTINRYILKSLSNAVQRVSEFDLSTLRPVEAINKFASLDDVCRGTFDLVTTMKTTSDNEDKEARAKRLAPLPDMLSNVQETLSRFQNDLLELS